MRGEVPAKIRKRYSEFQTKVINRGVLTPTVPKLRTLEEKVQGPQLREKKPKLISQCPFGLALSTTNSILQNGLLQKMKSKKLKRASEERK